MPIVFIDRDRCKGCGLCVHVCKKGVLVIASSLNVKGYFPVEVSDGELCTGCAACMLVCPDMAIEVDDERE
ncbi:MAG: 4Fe-4S binding protein [bacterium]